MPCSGCCNCAEVIGLRVAIIEQCKKDLGDGLVRSWQGFCGYPTRGVRQLLLDTSYEFGVHTTLGLIEATGSIVGLTRRERAKHFAAVVKSLRAGRGK